MTNVAYRNELGCYVKPKHWTKSSKMCYERGCVCEGCKIKASLSSLKCQMKASVLESVRVFGAPFERAKVVMD